MEHQGWLFWVRRLFETVFQSILSRIPERDSWGGGGEGGGRRGGEGGRKDEIGKRENITTTPSCTYFWVRRLFETVFQSILSRIPERDSGGGEGRGEAGGAGRGEEKMR